MINAKHCNNLVMKDIILKGSYYWTIVPQDCDRVLIDHIRLAGSRVGNDDGVDPCNSSKMCIRDRIIWYPLWDYRVRPTNLPHDEVLERT